MLWLAAVLPAAAQRYVGAPVEVLPKAAILSLAAKDAAALPELPWLKENRDKPGFLTHVNRLVNISSYAEEPTGKDVWQRPLTLFRHGGDCEDFAIAKYGVLRALGMPAEYVRVLVVRARRTGDYHAILTVADSSGDWTGLDNRRTEPWRSADFLAVYQPVYAVNEAGVWLYETPLLVDGGGVFSVRPSR